MSYGSLERIDGEVNPPAPLSGFDARFGAPKLGKKWAKDDFCGTKLRNKAHSSSVLTDALLACKSNAHPHPPLPGHVLMDNRYPHVSIGRRRRLTSLWLG